MRNPAPSALITDSSFLNHPPTQKRQICRSFLDIKSCGRRLLKEKIKKARSKAGMCMKTKETRTIYAQTTRIAGHFSTK